MLQLEANTKSARQRPSPAGRARRSPEVDRVRDLLEPFAHGIVRDRRQVHDRVDAAQESPAAGCRTSAKY